MDGARQRHLGNRLRIWRIDNGLTIDEVSDLTGLCKSMISRVERGERDLAPLTRVKVARRLGVAVSELFDVELLAE